MAIRQKKDGRWVVYYRARDGSGKQVEEYFGRGAEGEVAAQKRNRELGIRNYTPKKRLRYGIPFWELAKPYVQNKPFNANSKRHLKIRLVANILPFFGNRIVQELTHSDMDSYVKKRTADGVKFSTISRELTDVKAILNWSVRRQPPLIAFNPVRDYQGPGTDDAIIFPPTMKEIQAILKHSPEHLRRAIHIAYFTGMRPGRVELLSMTWQYVNFDAQTLEILSAHKGGPIRRTVDIHPEFLPILEGWYKQDREIFEEKDISDRLMVHWRKRPVGRILKSWKAALVKAGITRRLRPYDMRHHFVTRAIEGGADIKTVSEIVGSSPRTLMQTYQHVSNPLRKRTILAMEGLEEKKKDET